MKKVFLSFLFFVNITAGFAQHPVAVTVYFDLDKYNISTGAASSLDSFIAVFNAGERLKLSGYCDSTAGYFYNDLLSEKRTGAVKNYLVSMGFDVSTIIEEKGFGKRKPLNSNASVKERSLNRRVEIIVTAPNETAAAKANPLKKTQPEKTLSEQIKDTEVATGKNIILNNLNFYGGTHKVLPESMQVLQELLEIMQKNPALEIIVEGHICCQEGIGDGFDIETQTNNLSENRAKEIYNYLHQNGIAVARLQYKGLGHQFPLTSSIETTEEERIANRRVEIKIVKK